MDRIHNFSVVILDEASIDIEEAIDWYETQKVGLGLEFYQILLTAFQVISSSPYLYPVHFLFVRRAIIHRFPYTIFYAVDEVNTAVEIVAVFHQRISPDELKRRLNFE